MPIRHKRANAFLMDRDMAFLRIYMRVLGLLAPVWRIAALLVLANLVLTVAQFAVPALFGAIVNQITSADVKNSPVGWSDLLPKILAWAGAGLFTIAAGVLVAMHADRLAHRRRLAAMAAYFDHVLHLPYSFHTNIHSGRLLKIMLEGTTSLWGLWLSFFRENCAAFAALLVLLPAIVTWNWRLGGLLLVLMFVFGALTIFIIRRTEALQGQVEKYHADLAERASDVLGNLPIIQSFTRIDLETRELGQIMRALLSAQIPVLSWWAVATVVTKASATLTTIAIFLTGFWLYLNHQTTIGEIIAYMSFATMLTDRLEQVVGFINVLFMQTPKLQQFFETLDTPPNVRDRPGAIDPGEFAGNVRFEDVAFTYDGRRNAVDHISVDVTAGETIALVGATGSGKSTTLSLLHRVFDPQVGRITIDGTDIRDMKLAALRRNIGVVFQEPMLFARTVEENLRIGKPDATDAEIETALQRAQAADFVARQPEGLKTIIGERGRSLSGGERQRLAIARTLLKDPPVLIFDEATAALDAVTEKQLQAALEAATQGRTTFVIAHRLATIRNASRILVFEAGRVVENGTFEELVAQNGRFATLARAQFMAGDLV